MDRLIRGLSKNARFFLVDTTEIVKEAKRIHKCTPGAISIFGRFLTAGVIMGATLKGDDVLTLRTSTDGIIGKMLLTVNSNGDIKGYLENPGSVISEKNGNGSNSSDFLGKGSLTVIKDMGLKEPYTGFSEMNSGDIAKDIAYYYYTSEQVPTVISLGVSFTKDGEISHSGGYMIQLMPGADEEFISMLEEKISIMRSFTELRENGMELERIAKLIYEDIRDHENEKLIENYDILEEKKLSYKCNCSKDRFYSGVITLGKTEIEKSINKDGCLEVECHFCGKTYEFKKDDFKNF